MAVDRGWRPKLVALDIDGTLVDEQGVLPAAVHQAVQRVVASDVPVVLATGRSWHGTHPIATMLGLPPGIAVSSNGAVVVDYPPMQVRSKVTFDPRAVIDKVRTFAPQALLAVEELGVGYRVTGEFPEGDLTGQITVTTPEDLAAHPVTRVIIRDPQSSEADFLLLAEQLGLHGVSYYIGWSAWLDISPEGVDKSSGLTQAIEAYGVEPSDVLALGDGRNDIEMLTWAGRGVALGQAPPEVQAVADAVTAPFAEGGTEQELNRWFG